MFNKRNKVVKLTDKLLTALDELCKIRVDMKAKVRKIINQLESVGLLVNYDDEDKLNPHIEIRRNELKKPLCEIIFDKKGNVHSLCIGKKQTRSTWIKLQ